MHGHLLTVTQNICLGSVDGGDSTVSAVFNRSTTSILRQKSVQAGLVA